jgi:uncharacterized protein (DUF1697 family)
MIRNQLPSKYLALLRGINVGGHHKVPMEVLRKEFLKLGFTNVMTLLNSGNVIFEATETSTDELEKVIAESLQKALGFPIPVLVREADAMLHILHLEPFKNINVTADTRLYVSFLKQETTVDLKLPWLSDDQTYLILDVADKTIYSVLELSTTKTPKGMDALEKLFGKEITTRNWNTVSKIVAKLQTIKV